MRKRGTDQISRENIFPYNGKRFWGVENTVPVNGSVFDATIDQTARSTHRRRSENRALSSIAGAVAPTAGMSARNELVPTRANKAGQSQNVGKDKEFLHL